MRHVVLALFGLLLAGCGGGGGGGSGGSATSSPPAVAAANLTAEAAEDFVAYTVFTLIGGATARIGPTLSVLSTTPQFAAQQSGCLQGTVAIAGSRDASNNVNGTATFTNLENCFSLTLNGTATVEGQIGGTQVANLSLTFSDLIYTVTGTSDQTRVAGSMSIVWRSLGMGGIAYTMTINGDVFDGSTKIFSLQNFTIDSVMSAGVQDVLVSGRVIDPVYGYADISSTNRLALPSPSIGPSSGTFFITGSTQMATVTAMGSGNYAVAIGPK